MAKTNPFTFLQEVRNETSKVTWPTRREAGVTTVMVLIFVFIMMVYLGMVNWLLSELLSFVLSL